MNNRLVVIYFTILYVTFLTRGLIILASSTLHIVNGRYAIALWANNFLDDETNQGMREVFLTLRRAVGCTLTVYLFVSLYLARAPPSKTQRTTSEYVEFA